MAINAKPRAGVMISPELHAEILKACPPEYKLKAFVDAVIRSGLEQLKKKGKKK